MIVVDATVLVSALAHPDSDGEWAGSVLQSRGLIAPQLVLVEATNSLRSLEHRKTITATDAGEARRDLVSLAVSLVPFAPFSDRVWELRSNLTAYDAWYVAVAEAFRVPLATLDQRLVAAPGPRCKFLTP